MEYIKYLKNFIQNWKCVSGIQLVANDCKSIVELYLYIRLMIWVKLIADDFMQRGCMFRFYRNVG
jgi:hypothetical protein